MKTVSSKVWALLVIVQVSFVAMYHWYENEHAELPVYGIPVGNEDEHVVPAFKLLNQDSVWVDSKQFEGKISIAYFFFASCGTICPKMTDNMEEVQKAFANQQDIIIEAFTVNPEKDKPVVLKQYAEMHNAELKQWQFFTGPKNEIYTLAKKGFLVNAANANGKTTESNDFIHSNLFVLVDAKHHIRGYYEGTDINDVNQLIKDIRKLQKS